MSASQTDYKGAIELAIAMASRNPLLTPEVRAELFAIYLSGALQADVDQTLSNRIFDLVEARAPVLSNIPAIIQPQAH